MEDDVLDENRRLAPILRQVIALGGQAHSQPLRTWALRELQGYEGTDVPIPDYRRIPAPLVMDGLTARFKFREQPVSSSTCPTSPATAWATGSGSGRASAKLSR